MVMEGWDGGNEIIDCCRMAGSRVLAVVGGDGSNQRSK